MHGLARAKVNLCLHVTGRRADGYHLLDSMVGFADVADRLTVAPAAGLRLTITGPMGAGLAAEQAAGADNLVLRAARLLGGGHLPGGGDGSGRAWGAAITLHKVLPVASGLGGGSADAAAALRLLSALWGVGLPAGPDVLALGADVPVCLAGVPARMQGIGEVVTPLPHPLPAAWLVLVNPGVALATPGVFGALLRRDHQGLPRDLPRLLGAMELAAFLQMQRNDLEPAAIGLAPVVGTVRAALSAQPGCLLARMSGAGATCFGLFAGPLDAAAAAAALRRAHPGWWVEAGALAS